MIWGATFDVIADMQYVGNGSFKKENVNIKFVDPNDPTTNPPSWLTWVEERYYFISTINGPMFVGEEETMSRLNNLVRMNLQLSMNYMSLHGASGIICGK